MTGMEATGDQGFEQIVERGDVPIARAASPLWKWAFIGTMVTLGVGALAAVFYAELSDPAPVEEGEERRPRLRFNVGDYEVPTFAPPAPEPVVEPARVEVPESPVTPYVPELPPPEPRAGYPIPELPPPIPSKPESEVEPVETPEEIARKRRLAAPLGGSGGSVSSVGGEAGEGAERNRGGLDLSVTRAATATARRLSDMTFLLPKGTYIGCILDTAIQSDQAGMVGCTLPRDVYGADGTVVLLDRGSQVLGEYRSATLSYGKRRIFVVWDRVRTPEGVIVDIASPGTGPLGRSGMGGKVDNHYWERVGIPVLMSAVSFGVQSYAREQLTSDQSRFIESTTTDSLSTVLAEFAKIKPTLHKNQGDPINILVARDVDLSPVYQLRRRSYGR